MKLKTILLLTFMIGIATAVLYQGNNREVSNPVSAQIGGGCSSYTAATYPCGDNETCGTGDYTSTAAFYNGAGINGQELRNVNCDGTECGSVPNVSTAYFNGYCCDQDNDGFEKTACGGTDCNDDDYNINPSKPEICDGKDNNCNGQTDENCPTPTPTPGGGGPGGGGCTYFGNYCGSGYYSTGGGFCCQYSSPLLLDIDGDGFEMTDYYEGVPFDVNGDGIANQTSWTKANTDDAWLVLDRNENNRIDNGLEMFGDASEQPAAQNPRNGFASLAVFDTPARGGNNDGKINRNDTIFSKLRLWQDRNHNGVSEPTELSRLPALNVKAVFLDYRESRRTDQHGNRFRFRAKVHDRNDAQVGRWAWDIFLVIAPPIPNARASCPVYLMNKDGTLATE